MSGGIWNFENRRLSLLAEQIRDDQGGRGRDSDSPPLEFPTARQAMAGILDALDDLLNDLDYHFSDDSFIPDEKAWMLGAELRLRQALLAFRTTS